VRFISMEPLSKTEDPGFDTMLATAKPLRFQGRCSKAEDAIARLAKKASEYLEE